MIGLGRKIIKFRSPFLLISLLLLTSCSYLQNRSTDFGEMINVGIEGGTVTASVQLSNQVVGFGGPSTETVGYGGMNGWFGKYFVTESNFWSIANAEDPSDPTILPFFHRVNPDDESFAYNPDWEDKWTKYWHVEASVACVYGARLGVNVAEVVDFVLGIVLIDIAGDDDASEQWPY